MLKLCVFNDQAHHSKVILLKLCLIKVKECIRVDEIIMAATQKQVEVIWKKYVPTPSARIILLLDQTCRNRWSENDSWQDIYSNCLTEFSARVRNYITLLF